MHGITLGESCKEIYFIGIGGIHMSAMAEMLSLAGYNVSGSDQKSSDTTDRLKKLGLKIITGPHKAENIPPGAELIVFTAAVKENNPEYMEAMRRGLPILSRAALLGEILENFKNPICIAGTHGKTTVTSMLAEIFIRAGMDPSILIGGELETIKSAFRAGESEDIIVEACEYCDSFLEFSPQRAIILNIETDHLDYFEDLDAIYKSFTHFAKNIRPGGTLIISSEIPRLNELVSGLNVKIITYGNTGDFSAESIVFRDDGCASFDVLSHGKKLCRVNLAVPGMHNVLNAIAALACADDCGIAPEKAAAALGFYRGAKRRFQLVAETGSIRIYDDYAHHPTEIRATVSAASKLKGRKWFVFQPHTRSRTLSLLEEFSQSFDDAENIIILDIYTPVGREEDDIPIHSQDLAAKIRERGKKALYFAGMEECRAFLEKNCRPGDAVITMGAGDVNKLFEKLHFPHFVEKL